MTQDEATELVDYYEEHRQERAKMKQEIGIEHPASHYIEALERYIEHLEDEYAPSQDACTISDIRNASVGTNMQPLLIPETWDKLLMESALQHHAARYTKNSQ